MSRTRRQPSAMRGMMPTTISYAGERIPTTRDVPGLVAPAARPAPAQPEPLGYVSAPKALRELHPDLYALMLRGDCMSSAACDGDVILLSLSAPLIRGELVALIPKAGTPMVKRLLMTLWPGSIGVEPHPASDVLHLVVVQQDNPSRRYDIPAHKLCAVHAVVGVVRAGQVTVTPADAGECPA